MKNLEREKKQAFFDGGLAFDEMILNEGTDGSLPLCPYQSKVCKDAWLEGWCAAVDKFFE